MDYLAPPMFDTSNIDLRKFKMSSHLKALGSHVYLTNINKSYLDNDKHIEANAQALIAVRQSLSKDHLCMISHCDSAFAV